MPDLDPIQLHVSTITDVAAGIGIEQLVQQLLSFGETVTEVGFQAAAAGEQMRVGFDSAFGSGASSMLSNLDAFSYKTSLTNTQLDNLALKLNTASVPADQIASTLQDITNVASGTGTSMQDISTKADAMGQALARAFQYGKVSSLTLRPLISENIPIIDALVKVINDSGGTFDASASAMAKQAKEVENAKAKHESLVHSIADEQKQLNILNETHIKLGFGVINSAKTQDSHNKAVEDAKYKLAQLNEELLKNDKLMQAPTASPITRQDLLSQTKNISISAEQLQAAYKFLGEGKYAGDAQKQAATLNGTIKNLQATFTDLARDIIGVNSDDSIVKGGLFATLKDYATQFFNYLQAHKSEIETWFKNELKVFIDYVVGHKGDIESFFKTIVTDLQAIGKWFTENKATFEGILGFIGGVSQFAAGAGKFIGGAGNIINSISSPDSQGGMSHLNYAALNNVIGTSPVGQALGYQNNSRKTNITMHNNVSSQADWSSIAAQIGWLINGR